MQNRRGNEVFEITTNTIASNIESITQISLNNISVDTIGRAKRTPNPYCRDKALITHVFKNIMRFTEIPFQRSQIYHMLDKILKCTTTKMQRILDIYEDFDRVVARLWAKVRREQICRDVWSSSRRL